jgi:hypothetical protein
MRGARRILGDGRCARGFIEPRKVRLLWLLGVLSFARDLKRSTGLVMLRVNFGKAKLAFNGLYRSVREQSFQYACAT